MGKDQGQVGIQREVIIATPKNPEARRRGMVALCRSDPETLSCIHNTHLPWTDAWCEPGEDALFSISAVPIVAGFAGFKGYADDGIRQTVRLFLAEARVTTSKKELCGVPKGAYPWASLLSSEFIPRNYQLSGMERLWRRVASPKRLVRGQILKDDVGLGKTIQMAGIIARMVEEGQASPKRPVVVVSSPSMVGQWHDELRRFVPALDAPTLVSPVLGDRDSRLYRLRPGATVYVTHHQMLRLPQYATQIASLFGRCSGVILDESSAFANYESQTTIWARKLCREVPFVIATNATPIENKLSDTFGQMSVADEPILGSFACFAPRYLKINPRYGTEVGTQNLEELRLRLAGSWFGRRHEDVGSEIPAVISEVRSVTLGKQQARVYTAATEGFVTNSDTGAVGLAQLAAVERAALASDFTNPKAESAKLDDLAELLDGDLAGHRVLVFSKYRQCIVFAEQRLKRFGPYVIHGKVPLAKRDDIRRRFCMSGGFGRVLLGTEAMAKGLNLQDATVVVNLDLPWNHGKLRQRVGRIARIGQKSKSVLVISYAAVIPGRRMVDQYFLGLVMTKRTLSEGMYGADAMDEVNSAPVDVGAVRAFLRSGA